MCTSSIEITSRSFNIYMYFNISKRSWSQHSSHGSTTLSSFSFYIPCIRMHTTDTARTIPTASTYVPRSLHLFQRSPNMLRIFLRCTRKKESLKITLRFLLHQYVYHELDRSMLQLKLKISSMSCIYPCSSSRSWTLHIHI